MKTPLVSICVDTYNQENYLRDCLDGIVMQKTDFVFEAIVIDDASSDSNPEIIMEYAEKYPDIIRPILLKENYWSQGRSKFFEVFLPIAKGKYVAFCEGDDYWIYESKLQQQVDFLESHSDYSMCFHNHKLSYEKNVLKGKYNITRLTNNRDIQIKYALLTNLIQSATIVSRLDVIKTDSLLQETICKNGIRFSDLIYWVSYFCNGKVFGFSGIWSIYRKNHQGVTVSNLSKNDLDEIYCQQLNLISDKFKNQCRSIKRVTAAGILIRKSSSLWKKGKKSKALLIRTLTFILYPTIIIPIYLRIFLNKDLFGISIKQSSI